MNKGKQVGEYSLKMVTITTSPGPGGLTLLTGNYEGTSTEVGAIFVTTTFAGTYSGTFSTTGISFSKDGEAITSTGSGRYEKNGTNHWRTEGILTRSNGDVRVVEGEMDLATRAWTGKQYEPA